MAGTHSHSASPAHLLSSSSSLFPSLCPTSHGCLSRSLLAFFLLHSLLLFSSLRGGSHRSLPHFLPASALPPSPPQHNLWYYALHVTGLAVDDVSGDVYMSDSYKNRIIRQSAQGQLREIFPPTASPSTELFSPYQLALHNGLLYVADSSNNRIVVLGKNALTDKMELNATIAAPDGFTACTCLAVSQLDGSLYVADGWGGSVAKLTSGGQSEQWIYAAGLLNTTHIAAITLDSSDTLYLADASLSGNRILRIFSNGTVAPVLPAHLDMTTIRSIHWSPHPSAANPLGALYVLLQPPSPAGRDYLYNPPSRVVRVSASTGVNESEWRGVDSATTCPQSFNSWPAALFVHNGTGDVYFSDAILSTQGCSDCCDGAVRRLAADGQSLHSYTMDDELWNSLHYVHYDHATCTIWYAWQYSDWRTNLGRMAADGRTAVQIFPTPTIPLSGRQDMVQHVTLIAADYSTEPESLLLVTQGDAYFTSSMYRFSPATHRFTTLDYEAAIRHGSQTNPFRLAGLTLDEQGYLYVSVVADKRVVKLSPAGEFVPSFDSSSANFTSPLHLAIAPSTPPTAAYSTSPTSYILFALDQGSRPAGRLLSLDTTTGRLIKVHNAALPTMHVPQAMLFDRATLTLWLADLNGHIFHMSPYSDVLLSTYFTVPPAHAISALTLDRYGSLYALDEYTFRVIVLVNVTAGEKSLSWPPAHTACAPLPTAAPSTVAKTVGLVVLGVVAAVVLLVGSVYLWRWKRRRDSRSGRPTELSSLSSSLLSSEERQYESEAVDDGVAQMSAAAVAPQFVAHYSPPPSPSPNIRHSYSYYVSLYEVGVALGDPQSDEEAEAYLYSLSAPLSEVSDASIGASDSSSIVRPRPQRPFDSSISPPPVRSRSPFSPPSSRALQPSPAFAALDSPSNHRITSLRSSLKNLTVLPTFVDEVKDLTPLGEGSAGRVYRGYHRGVAVVVKLPKSAEITGAQWREWQAHLRLPPHPHLVTFIGALVMESTNFLCMKLVQQGSLKGLLGAGDSDSDSGSGSGSANGSGSGSAGTDSMYSRPYAVLRAARELCSALCHMHSHNLVHRDVSARNVLVDSDGTFVLADLGLCREMGNQTNPSTTPSESIHVAIPVRWTAPESLLSREFTSKSDVWSLGVTLWEMSNRGAVPYGQVRQTTHEQQRMIEGIVRGHVALNLDAQWKMEGEAQLADKDWQDETGLMPRVRRLIGLCLMRDVEQRPDSARLLQCVEREMEEWEKEGGEAVQRVKQKWTDYHRTLSEQ